MALREGFWDCKYCDTKKIRGSIRECPNCGCPRGEDTKFYLDRANAYVVPEVEAAKINRNPDWLCPYCGGLNSDSDKICKSCGSERTKENLNYFEMRHKQEQKQEQLHEEVLGNNESDNYTFANHTNGNFIANDIIPFFQKYWKYVLIGFSSVLVIAIIIALFIPREKDITVQSISWERNISIERYKTVNEEGWDLPIGARLKYSEDKIKDY